MMAPEGGAAWPRKWVRSPHCNKPLYPRCVGGARRLRRGVSRRGQDTLRYKAGGARRWRPWRHWGMLRPGRHAAASSKEEGHHGTSRHPRRPARRNRGSACRHGSGRGHPPHRHARLPRRHLVGHALRDRTEPHRQGGRRRDRIHRHPGIPGVPRDLHGAGRRPASPGAGG
ncbi:hypothetical protein D3C85_1148350 [compost metagenome]